jgi:hypothetical protein
MDGAERVLVKTPGMSIKTGPPCLLGDQPLPRDRQGGPYRAATGGRSSGLGMGLRHPNPIVPIAWFLVQNAAVGAVRDGP